jgi:hypothetical protein
MSNVDPEIAVARAFGISREEFNRATHSRSPAQISEQSGEHVALHGAVDAAYRIIARAAKAAGVAHAVLLSALADRALAETDEDVDQAQDAKLRNTYEFDEPDGYRSDENGDAAAETAPQDEVVDAGTDVPHFERFLPSRLDSNQRGCLHAHGVVRLPEGKDLQLNVTLDEIRKLRRARVGK